MKFMTVGFILSNFCPRLPQAIRFAVIRDCARWPTQSSTMLERQIPDNGVQLAPSFPQKKGGLRPGIRADPTPVATRPLLRPQEPIRISLSQRRDGRIHQLHPAAQVNDLQTTWSRLNLHFTSKKRGSTYMRGNGVNNSCLNPGFYPFTYGHHLRLTWPGSCQPSHACLQ